MSLSTCKNTQIHCLHQEGGNSRLISQMFLSHEKYCWVQGTELKESSEATSQNRTGGPNSSPVHVVLVCNATTGARPGTLATATSVSRLSHSDTIKHIQAWGCYNQKVSKLPIFTLEASSLLKAKKTTKP